VKRFWNRWGAILKRTDRYTNPNLDIMRDDWMVNAEVNRIESARLT